MGSHPAVADRGMPEHPRIRRSRLRALVWVSGAALILVLIPAGYAEAYTYTGCRYQTIGQANPSSPAFRYGYVAGLSSYWQTRTSTAASWWTSSTGAQVTWANGINNLNLTVTAQSYAWSTYAQTTWKCSLGFYSSTPQIQINSRLLTSGGDATVNSIIINHEFGHAIGLDHVTSQVCTSAAAVMNNGAGGPGWTYLHCSGSPLPPYGDDIAGSAARY